MKRHLRLCALIGILLTSSGSYALAQCAYGCRCLQLFVGISPWSGNGFCIDFGPYNNTLNGRQVWSSAGVGGILTTSSTNTGPSCQGFDAYTVGFPNGCFAQCSFPSNQGSEGTGRQGTPTSSGAMSCWMCDFPDQILDTCRF
jgi:hypothetical protein